MSLIYRINTYLLFITSLANFILGLIVYLRNKKSITNITFTLLAFNIGLWSFFTGLIYVFPHLFWINQTTFFIGFSIGTTSLLFINNFPIPSKKTPFWFYFIPISWQIFIAIGYFIPNWFFEKLYIQNGLPIWKAGLGYKITSIIFIFYIIYYFYLLYVKYKKAKGIEKMQVKYLFLGLAIFGSFAIFLSFILAGFYAEELGDFTPSTSIFIVALAAYAIIKHQLMDIRLIIIRSLAYSLLLFLVASFYVLVIVYLKDPLISYLQISPNTTFILTGLLLVLGFSPIKRLIEKLTDRWLYKGRYNPSLVLDRIGEITNSILLLDPLLKSLLQTLTSEMKISKMAILLENQSQTSGYKISSKLKAQSSKLSFDSLLKLLGKNNLLVTDEQRESETKEILRELDIALLVPLLIEGKPIGLLVLGDKKSGDAYTKEDINFLITLSHQIAIAISNALSFAKVIEDKEKINKLLQEKSKWLKRKHELIAIAVHEMNTPVAAVEGFLSMLINEKLGKLPQKMKEYLKRAYLSSRKSASLIKKVMEAAEFK